MQIDLKRGRGGWLGCEVRGEGVRCVGCHSPFILDATSVCIHLLFFSAYTSTYKFGAPTVTGGGKGKTQTGVFFFIFACPSAVDDRLPYEVLFFHSRHVQRCFEVSHTLSLTKPNRIKAASHQARVEPNMLLRRTHRRRPTAHHAPRKTRSLPRNLERTSRNSSGHFVYARYI